MAATHRRRARTKKRQRGRSRHAQGCDILAECLGVQSTNGIWMYRHHGKIISHKAFFVASDLDQLELRIKVEVEGFYSIRTSTL